MTDNVSKRKRSEVMSRVRSRGNKSTEERLVAVFRELGITGWRRHQPLPGKPDFVFTHHRVVLFADGCFWHGCRRCYRRPATNRRYWDRKLAQNRLRDRTVGRLLRQKGWIVLRVWEHDIRSTERIAERVHRLLATAR
jgi:DNA mismatch endonuclease (patch repair protein)